MRILIATIFAGASLLAQGNLAWQQHPSNGREYALLDPMPWAQAEAAAVAAGGHLATLRSSSEEAWIRQQFGDTLWIGLTDAAQEGTWVWTSGEPVTYTNWLPGEPNNASNEDFTALAPGGWNDRDGLALVGGVAERPTPTVGNWYLNPANGHHYALTPQLSWTDAEALAQQFGGHLVTIRNAAENAWLASTFANPSECHWIGLHDTVTEGVFEWTSGEPVGYTDWFPNEPNNANGDEDFAHLSLPWVPIYAAWNDAPNGATVYGRIARGIIEVPAALSATLAPFGMGCPGPNGSIPMLAAAPGGEPRLGATATVEVTGLPMAITIPIFVYGTSKTVDPGPPAYNLPVDLGPLGWPGCQQLVSDDAHQLTITNTGQMSHSIPVPMDPGLLGFQYFVQACVLYTPSGVAVSNGIMGTVGL
ncbi:MAG: hypothetical protein KAI24_18960 [Planctomycetes bacterium]|nr:hypothetical protein [Planctomycetota bacterium]